MESTRSHSAFRRLALVGALVLFSPGPAPLADPYVTPASIYRWNSASGIRFNDVGGIRFNDAGGIRFNDVGGIRFNDAGGWFSTEASGIRFNDAGGIRFNDAGGIRFNDAGGNAAIDLEILDLAPFMADTSSIGVVITYDEQPDAQDLNDLRALGITGGTVMRRLPMVVVTATRGQIAAIADLPAVRSVWADRMLAWVDHESRQFIGLDQAEQDLSLRAGPGLPFTGDGVTIAFVDTGIDATHPDLQSRVVQNARVDSAMGNPLQFLNPTYTEGISNTDLVLGHGTFGAGIAAGTGQASAGLYRGVAPGADLVGVSVGDVYIVNVLEGFDYVLHRAAQYGIRVVNCSFSTSGPFDPDDPVNIATQTLHDEGITVVFAAGNYGPAPDTLSPYAVAPWVIGVASGDKQGRLSDFSSRGIYNEGLYRPTLTAPGEGIISTSSPSLQGVFGVSGAPAGSSEPVPPNLRWAYSEASGTSFAAPHVAGVVALMLEADPALEPDAIKRILQSSATPMVARDRGEVGLGYLDAWAALTQVLNPYRNFGAYIPQMLDERRHGYVFGSIQDFSGIVPAGGAAILPLPGGAATLAVTTGIAWGPLPADLDVEVLDAGGNELARSASFNAPGLFGMNEGLSLYHPGAPATLRIASKLPSAVDVAFEGQYQTIDPSLPHVGDLNGLSSQDKAIAIKALTSLAMMPRPTTTPRGRLRLRNAGDGSNASPKDCFCGAMPLLRGEAARLIALAGHLPQTVPAVASFGDVPATNLYFPYVESVASAVARRGVTMPPRDEDVFGLDDEVERIELAMAAVAALGLREEAESWSGELELSDAADLPPGSAGYAALALSLGILRPSPTPNGPVLLPRHAITRLDAARAAVALLKNRR